MLGLHFKIILIIKTTKHIITLLLLLKQEIVRPFMKFHLNLCHAELASVLVFDCFPMQSFGFFFCSQIFLLNYQFQWILLMTPTSEHRWDRRDELQRIFTVDDKHNKGSCRVSYPCTNISYINSSEIQRKLTWVIFWLSIKILVALAALWNPL